jgi:hypothetical protein
MNHTPIAYVLNSAAVPLFVSSKFQFWDIPSCFVAFHPPSVDAKFLKRNTNDEMDRGRGTLSL